MRRDNEVHEQALWRSSSGPSPAAGIDCEGCCALFPNRRVEIEINRDASFFQEPVHKILRRKWMSQQLRINGSADYETAA